MRPHRPAAVRRALVALGLVSLLASPSPGQQRAAAPSDPAAIRGTSVIAVLPFRVHSAAALTRWPELLADRIEQRLADDPRIQVADRTAVMAAVDEERLPETEEMSDDQLQRVARRVGADAVVTGSITELAGRYSIDVRVTPATAGARSLPLSDTANSRGQVMARIDALANRVLERVAGAGAAPVQKVVIVGAADLEGELSRDLETRIGEPFDPAAAQRDLERMEERPEVASVSLDTDRSLDGVDVTFRVVRAERIFGGAGTLESDGETVAEVRVRGNRRIDSDAILSRVRTRGGETLRPAQVAADVREIFALGFFRNVVVYRDEGPEGLILTFEVEENPVVRQIAVTGNDNIDSETLRDSLTLTTGSTLDYPLLHENQQRIEALYRAEGYYLAKVSYEIQPMAPGSIAIDFDIEEGEKLKLREIVFEGNEHFTDEELAEQFSTRTWKFYSYATSWYDKSGTYSEPVFLRDLRTVEKAYTDSGFLQVEVGQPDVQATEAGITVVVDIEEGERFSVGKIDVAGDDTVDLEGLRQKLKLREGEIFNRSHLTEDVENLETHYTDRGFYFANVAPSTKLDAENQTVDVTFEVEKGPLYFIRQIEIAGNTRTVDPVIRREMRVVEGQLYSARAVQVSSRRIQGMGFFEDVSFEPRPTDDPSQLDLDVNVVERPTGSFSFGAGFSSQDSFVFTASLAEQNLFGRGYGVNLSADLGGRTSRYFFSFTDPYFLGTDFSLGATFFLTSIRFEDFEQDQQGFDLTLGHSLSEDNTSRGNLRYSYSTREIEQNTGVNAAGVIFRELLQGNESTSILGVSFRTDTRDDRFAPTSGFNYGGTLEYAGLGGFANFLRIEGRFAWYLGAPKWLLKRSSFVFSTRIGYTEPFNNISDYDFGDLTGPSPCSDSSNCDNVAQIDQIDTNLKLPLTERYFLGGLGTFQMRGYKARSLGPRRAILKRSGLVGTGNLFSPVGTQIEINPEDGSLRAVCNDETADDGSNPNQGNGDGNCNDLDDNDIDDFDDLDETDVIGGSKFIANSFEYRFPISEEVGLQGVLFIDGGNAFAENEEMFDPEDWRYGYGAGVLWFSPFGPLQLVLGFPIDALEDEDSPVFEFSVGGFGL